MIFIIFLLVVAVLPSSLYGQLDNNGFPLIISRCYLQKLGPPVNCLEHYLSSLQVRDGAWRVLDTSAIKWINSLGRQALKRAQILKSKCKNKKSLRQIFNVNKKAPFAQDCDRSKRTGSQRLVRREIRTLSDTERQEYFDAVNALKSDTSIRPNKYDALALLHQDDAIPSAHDGPNFLGWHRYYLVLFEEALRTKNPKVTLPYWDSTMDFRMEFPEQSVYWSEIFMGNPSGVVYTGPFAFWTTPTNNTFLRRGIPGENTSLLNPVKLREVFRQKFHYQILTPTNVSIESNLETHHDSVHLWIGGVDGHMGGLSTSPQEPAFWIFHCHVDYLWEVFREQQRKYGIDSSRDYPVMNIPEHHPYRKMDNLWPPLLNVDGYSNKFTKYLYRFEPAPTCQNKCGGAKSQFLYCDRRIMQCVSRSRSEFASMEGFQQVSSPYVPFRGSTAFFQDVRDSVLSDSAAAPNTLPRFRTGIVDPRTT